MKEYITFKFGADFSGGSVCLLVDIDFFDLLLFNFEVLF